MNNHSIGVFDSGYGGLTILKELTKELPSHDFLYLGDNARAPYGTRSFETVYQYTLQCVRWFFSQGCPLVILACNTASAKALRTIQQHDLPGIDPAKRVLGVIRPTSEVIGSLSASGHVGIFGTPGTVQSGSYLLEMAKYAPGVNVSQEACPMWVPLIENNEHLSDGADFFVSKHVKQLFDQDRNIDTILLGCTHYPLLVSKIEAHLPGGIQVISQGEIIARSLRQYLDNHPEMDSQITKAGIHRFFTTGDTLDFNTKGSQFYGDSISSGYADIAGEARD